MKNNERLTFPQRVIAGATVVTLPVVAALAPNYNTVPSQDSHATQVSAPNNTGMGENCGPALDAFGPDQGIGAYDHTSKIVCSTDGVSVSSETGSNNPITDVNCAPRLGEMAFTAWTNKNIVCSPAPAE